MKSVSHISKIVLLLTLLIGLMACTKIVPYYKPDIHQGNVITQVKVDQLRKNMTQTQVIDIMGSPSVQPTFDNRRLIYINSNLTGKGQYTEQKLILYFNKQGRLVSGEGDFPLKFSQ